MKVIDLLVRIANGEEVPKKIKWNNRKYRYIKDYNDYSYDNAYCLFSDDIQKNKGILEHLNDEVEIIEEDKKIEKLKDLNTDYYVKECFYETLSKEEVTLDIQTLKHKLNEIIDKLNEVE